MKMNKYLFCSLKLLEANRMKILNLVHLQFSLFPVGQFTRYPWIPFWFACWRRRIEKKMRAVSLWLRRKHQLSLALAFRRFSTSNSKVKIFDRELKRTQRDRAAWLTPSHDPLLHTVAQNLLDRLQVPLVT